MPHHIRSNTALSGFSDRKLLSSVTQLVKNEHLTTTEILVHLNEIEKRDLHLKLGCSSMFDYCVNHLGYSRSAAGRRVQAARCIKKFPEVYHLVRKGTLSLTTVALIAPVITEANKKQVLDRVRGKSQYRIEAIVAGYRPPIAFQDRVKPVRVAVPSDAGDAPTGNGLLASQSRSGTDIMLTSGSGSKRRMADCKTVNPPAVPLTEEARATADHPNCKPGYKIKKQLLIQFLADEEFMTKYAEARSLLSNKLAEVSFEKVFEALLDEFIDRHSPAKKNARRAKRSKAARTKAHGGNGTSRNRDQRASASSNNQSRSGTDIMLTSRGKRNGKRRIPARTRDAIFERDNGRCTYIGANGRRCRSTHRLHVDHVVPVARGGTNARSNLRLLCAKHNNLEAKRVFGKARIDAYARRE